MLKIVTKIICMLVFSTLELYTTKKLIGSPRKKSLLNDILAIILLTIITYCMYFPNYSVETTLLRTILSIIVLKYTLKENLSKIVIAFILFTLIAVVADMMSYAMITRFLTLDQLRDTWYGILISNTSVALITTFIFLINPVRNFSIKFIDKLNKSNIIKTVIFFALSLMIILLLLLNITKNQDNSGIFLLDILIIGIFNFLIILLMSDYNKYNKLLAEYDVLLKYTQGFEDIIDEMELNNHEYKNQLAILKSYVDSNNKKEAIKIIKEMSNENIQMDSKVLATLKNIPKGGIKGLIYYKMIIAKQKQVNFYIDVSTSCIESMNNLNEKQLKILSKLIGVYLDNAIEAAELTKEKIVSLEIYQLDNKLNLVISNSIQNTHIDLLSIKEKGVSTKGEGRGKGLYLVDKLVNKDKSITSKTKIINNYYTQYIEINT